MLTTTEAAALLGLKLAMVRRHCQSGRIAATKYGRDWLITPDAIDAYQATRRSAGRPKKGTTMRTFTLAPINLTDLTATDLCTEAFAHGGLAYCITIYDATGTRQEPEAAEALYSDGRLGVAWGADATWADASDVKSGIELWLNDGDAWSAAN